MKRYRIYDIIPKYGLIPVIAVFAFNLITYYGTKLINSGMIHHDLTIELDNLIPLCVPFILIYICAFVQWVVGYVMISRESKEMCFYYLGAELIAKAICFIVFIIYPTTMARPEFTQTGLSGWILGIIYSVDAPTNLMPSIHCLESYLIARAAFKMKKASKSYRTIMVVASILIVASVLLVKQHVVLDVVTGVIVAEIGLAIARMLKLSERDTLWTRKK